MATEEKYYDKMQPQSEVERHAAWPWNESRTFLVFAALVIGFTLILFSRYLFGPRLYIFSDVGSDTFTVFYPNLVQMARYFQEEGIPGWSFYIGMGANFYPSYLLNPFHWIYLPMSPTSIAYSIVWVQAALMIGTGLVFYKFLRVARFALPVCIIGGLLYTFGGYAVLGNTWYGHAEDIFWMTCSFLGFELLLRKKIWWYFPLPFIFLLGTRGYFLILFMSAYGLVRMLDVYGPSWKFNLHGYKRMIVSGLVALLLVLPFVGGKWHKFANSPRVTGMVSNSERLADNPMFGMPDIKHNVTAIMRTFSNDMLGVGSDFTGWRNYLEAPCLYIGLITLLFVFQFFALAERRQKWIYGSFLFLWVVIMLFPWFRYAFYGFAGNYYKGALSLFIPFSFLLTGLMGFQHILSGKALNKPVLFGSVFFLLCLLWFPYHVPQVKVSLAMQVKVSLFLVAYGTLIWMLAAGKAGRLIFPLLVSMVGIEALLFAWPAINERETIFKKDVRDKKYHFDDTMEAVRQIKAIDKEPFYRMDKVYGSVKSGFNDAMVQGFFGTKSYQSHNHKAYVEFLDKAGIINGAIEKNTRWLIGLSTTNILHGLFSIKYLMSDKASQSKVDPLIYTAIDTVGSTVVSRNNFYIPFGIPFESYLPVSEYDKLRVPQKRYAFYFGIVADDSASWTNKLNRLPPVDQFSMSGKETIEHATMLADAAMKMDYFSHRLIKGHVDIRNTSMLFLSIPYDSGWSATVDGNEQPLEKVNFGFTGLLLEPGRHAIVLSYAPPLSSTGWLGTLVGLLCIGLLIRFRKSF